jgi:hypothetical protein
MGWKGTARSLNSALNEIQRDRQRAQRDYERQQAALAKMAEVERAVAEIELFEEYIDDLITLHHNDAPDVDWAGLAASSEPTYQAPAPTKPAAEKALADYKPGRLHSKKRQARDGGALEAAVVQAEQADEDAKAQSSKDHESAVEEWKRQVALAKRIMAEDRQAWSEAANQIDQLTGGQYIRFIDLDVPPSGPPTVKFGLQEQDIVPSKKKSQLKSGKLSEKEMPKGEFYATYQDYVCGALLWVSNTMLGLIPIPQVVATGYVHRVNTATGHKEETPIISAQIVRDTIGEMNLSYVDPSDGMANFRHEMKFKKTQGFDAIAPIEIDPDV